VACVVAGALFAALMGHGPPAEAAGRPGAADPPRQRAADRTSTLRVLATGDSMIYIVDSKLARAVRRQGGRLRSDPHPATGISKPALLDWREHARASARLVRPDVTVVFLGANDAFPLPTPSGVTAQCCDAAWIAEYARRARQVMRAYRRDGRGRVYWLLLPAPAPPALVAPFRAVNAALRLAARAFPDGVRLIDVGRIIAPGDRYQQQITYHGRPGGRRPRGRRDPPVGRGSGDRHLPPRGRAARGRDGRERPLKRNGPHKAGRFRGGEILLCGSSYVRSLSEVLRCRAVRPGAGCETLSSLPCRHSDCWRGVDV
jgi:lysophospholipase L1-like esterase